MKIRIYLFLVFMFSVKMLSAQQVPQYTQYVLNGFLLNPAVAGIENYTDLRIGNRTQWKGLAGAPNTRYLSVHAPIGKDFVYDNANSLSGQGENPMNRSYVQTYQAAAPHHGVGLAVVSDQTGPLSRTDLNASYAYHLGVSSRLNVSVGLSAGISQAALDASKLVFEDNSDAFGANTNYRKIVPNLSAGVWIYGPRFYGGLAIHQLLANSLAFVDNTSAMVQKRQPQLLLSAGYKLFLGDDIALMPTFMLNYMASSPLTVDANTKIAFKDKFWIGGGYRKNDSFSANAGFNIGYLFNVAYAYDFTTSKLKTVSNGSHEIVLGILLNNRYRVSCPQKNW